MLHLAFVTVDRCCACKADLGLFMDTEDSCMFSCRKIQELVSLRRYFGEEEKLFFQRSDKSAAPRVRCPVNFLHCHNFVKAYIFNAGHTIQ